MLRAAEPNRESLDLKNTEPSWSKASAFPIWDAKGHSEAAKKKLKQEEPKQLHAMFKEHPDHHEESATQRSATSTAQLEAKFRNVGLSEKEIEALLLRYWEDWKLREVKEKLGLDFPQNADRLCKRAVKKLKRAGLQDWLLRRIKGEDV